MKNLAQNNMEVEELAKAKRYFEKAKGKRIGLWMSELRRQYAIRMNKEGAKSRHIGAVTFLKHDQIWHYLNRCNPDLNVEKIVIEKMDEWIDKGLYPISTKRSIGNNMYKTSYILNENPGYVSNNKEHVVLWDKIIDGL